ncbi:MAG: patatin-like phospholipase family protein, partial [Acidimicrobiia bacterium]
MAKTKPEAKKVNLALQGGGAPGAYTGGGLDPLLEDERLEIEGISG